MVGDDIYPQILPEDTEYPAINFTRISGSRVQAMGGPDTLGPARIQINCWGRTQSEALLLAEHVRRSMDGHDSDLGKITVQTVTLIDQGDLPVELDQSNSKVIAYGIRQDYEIFYEDDI